MSFDPCAALTIYHDALERRDFDFVARAFADESIYISPAVGTLNGKAEILATMKKYFESLPDQIAKDEQVWRISDLVAACTWSLRASEMGTGKVVVRRGQETIRFNKAQRIVSVEVVDDV